MLLPYGMVNYSGDCFCNESFVGGVLNGTQSAVNSYQRGNRDPRPAGSLAF